MKADHPSHNDDLSFSFPLGGAGLEVRGPSRFASALKEARFARGWTQTALAAQISVTKRSIVSWETAERIPSVGMVVLLLDTLFPEEAFSLHQKLLCAYIVDDLEHQLQHKNPRQQRQDDLLLQRIQHVIERLVQDATRTIIPSPPKGRHTAEETHEPVQQEGELEPLFVLLNQLRQHPELIPVANDFVRELAPSEQER